MTKKMITILLNVPDWLDGTFHFSFKFIFGK